MRLALLSRPLPLESCLAVACHLTAIGMIAVFGLPPPLVPREKREMPLLMPLAALVVDERDIERKVILTGEGRKSMHPSPVVEKPKLSMLPPKNKSESCQGKSGGQLRPGEQVLHLEGNRLAGHKTSKGKGEDLVKLSTRSLDLSEVSRPPANTRAEPRYRHNPAPHYPQIARRRGWQGRVVVEATVQADGSVAQARLYSGSGYALLDKAAVATVNRWLFSPELRDGRPIVAKVLVPVLFSLN